MLRKITSTDGKKQISALRAANKNREEENESQRAGISFKI